MNQKIVSILLNYNSNHDLFSLLEDLNNQKNIAQIIIVVDNHSNIKSSQELKYWQVQNYPYAITGSFDEVKQKLHKGDESQFFFIYNDSNTGYSAGNNIGIRVAKLLAADSVFIVNPDMRIDDEDYLRKLAEYAKNDDSAAIVASRIIGVDGENQSPMVADNFWREFLWPKQLLPKLFKPPKFIEQIDSDEPVYVTKVIGCAMLLKMEFLQQIGFLDEATFLYSEEAILSSQVSLLGKKIKFIPTLKAFHMHKKEHKDNSSKRMQLMIKSRKYYIDNYSKYTFTQRMALTISYKLWDIAHKINSNI